ncbi:coiled-coil domain-containing protein 13-like [Watersipora subatra]|uniref:coiled-coil domain-containing protein 13-like n=1 Tax=Watersipora subatra TaxID=2589382 RepID=UPI00355AE8EB
MPDKDEEEALKKKFQQLQQQQHQKLQQRKLKKKSQEKIKHDTESNISMGKEAPADPAKTPAFGVNDELDLKVDEPLPKSSTYLSAELVEHLNEQIRELKDENGRLFKLLGERDYEIRTLKKKREEDKIALTGSSGLSADTAASKIVELSKRVRDLNATLETKKTETKQLFGRCRHLENELAKVSSSDSHQVSSVRLDDDVSPRSRVVLDAENKGLTEKLKMAEQRNAEYRNQLQGLRNDLKMAQKVISNEVGEGINFHDLLNTNSNWRGRAQQILGLQKKVGEMKAQLELQTPQQTSRSNSDHFGDKDLEAEFMGAKQSKGADMKHREVLRKLEKEKKEQQEKASSELKALESDYSSLKQKLDASKARNKVLSNENQSLKAEVQKLIAKGIHDDELISALIAQQAHLKTVVEQLTELQKQQKTSEQDQMTAATARNQQESNVIQQLKSIVSEKEGKVKLLEQELLQLKQAKIQESQMNSVGALFERPNSSHMETNQQNKSDNGIFPNYDDDEDDDKATLQPSPPPTGSPRHSSRTASRRSVKGTPTYNGTMNVRPKSSDGRVSASHHSRPSSKKNSRPSTSSARGQGKPSNQQELETQCQEYKSLAQAAQVERDKLMELVKVLQKRVDESNEQSLVYQNDMKAHKQNAVKLEKLIGRMKLEHNKASAGGPKKREKSSVSFGSMSDIRASLSIDKNSGLEAELALQRDENEALKAALESTLKAKQEDLKLYNDMVEQTKLVFLQGLRHIRASAT